MAILLEIEMVVENMWEEVKLMPIQELCKEVADWVVDLGTTASRESAYDHMLMIYWVNMNLVSHSLVSREAKREGDEETTRAWKEHNDDCHLMHRKIDVMAAHMGIPFYPAGVMQEGDAESREMGK